MNRRKTDKQNEEVDSALFTRISPNLHPGHGTNSVMIYLHYFFPPNIRTCAKLIHRRGGALCCVLLLAEKVRNANDEGFSL
jgi:hypothetical protein